MSDDKWNCPDYAKAVMGDPMSIAIFGDPLDDYPVQSPDSTFARAWATMSWHGKVVGVATSVTVGAIGAWIFIALFV